MSFWHFGNLKSGYGRSEFDRLMPGAGLSYTITSRELVLQAPHPTAGAAEPFKGAAPNTPIERNDFMTEKTEVINTRFSDKEKQIVEQYAAACGLTRSEYLRKRALGYEPRPALGDSFYQLYSKLCDLCNQSMTVETEKALLELITDIRRELMLPHKQSKTEVVSWLQQDSGQSKDG